MSIARNFFKLTCSVAVSLSIAYSAAANASVYSITDDFSTAANPNGAWTYGWLNTLGGTFTAYSETFNATAGGTVGVWHDPTVYTFGAPSVWNNSTSLAYSAGTVNYASGWAGFHPGQSGEFSDFRFTAQTSGSYAVSMDFQGADFAGQTSTDVHIRTAGGDVFSSLINGFGDSSRRSYDGIVFLNAGEFLDIAVGRGSNGTFWYDSTALRGTIGAVPEPETLALMLAGLGLTAVMGRRRKEPTAR